MKKENTAQKHPILDVLPEHLKDEVENTLAVQKLPAGSVIFSPGDSCEGLPLVLNGAIKVQMIGVSGNRIVLYRMGSHEICTLSIGCLIADRAYRAEAVVEESTDAVVLPRSLFSQMMAESECFRDGIMASYGSRLDDLMLLVEEVAFRRMDERLQQWLAARTEQGVLSVTHQQIADELGTAREVISRLLKELEKQGRLKLARGRIECLYKAD